MRAHGPALRDASYARDTRAKRESTKERHARRKKKRKKWGKNKEQLGKGHICAYINILPVNQTQRRSHRAHGTSRESMKVEETNNAER